MDHTGGVIDGDHLMAICALDMMEEGKLKKNTLVATVMSNMGLELVLKKAGIALVQGGGRRPVRGRGNAYGGI